MKRLIALAALWAFVVSFAPAETWLGMFMNSQKIGYARSATIEEPYRGAPATTTISLTVIQAGLLGSTLDIRMDAKTIARAGKPLAMSFTMLSGGREQKVDAEFGDEEVVCQVENAGHKSTRKLQMPKDGLVVDDSLMAVLTLGPGTKTMYVLDPMTVSFVKNQVTVKGKTTLTVDGRTVEATHVEISDPRATTNAYISSKGDLLKATGPLGIEMRPISRDEALAPTDSEARIDLAVPTSVPVKGNIASISAAKTVSYKIVGFDLAKLPSDGHQTTSGDVLKVHPGSAFDEGPIDAKWTRPGSNIPSDSPAFAEIARQIGGTGAVEIGAKAARHVYELMRPNAGIGVLRDAREVLDSREGVCRDYAILTATILRAAGVPTRLVAGLVLMDGRLYYHAWVEVHDGERWRAFDSTRPDGRVTAGHIKLSQGDVETAYVFPVLGNVSVEVVDAERD